MKNAYFVMPGLHAKDHLGGTSVRSLKTRLHLFKLTAGILSIGLYVWFITEVPLTSREQSLWVVQVVQCTRAPGGQTGPRRPEVYFF